MNPGGKEGNNSGKRLTRVTAIRQTIAVNRPSLRPSEEKKKKIFSYLNFVDSLWSVVLVLQILAFAFWELFVHGSCCDFRRTTRYLNLVDSL